MLREPVGKQLLLIEDDEVLCRFLQESLQQEGYSVITLLEGEGIPKMMEHHSPRLVILDLMLPGKDGMYWLKWLVSYYPTIPVIITSAKVQPHERLQGLECGAQDYLVKPFHDRELLLRIKNLLSSSSDNSRDKLIQMGCLTLDKVNQTVTTGDGRESLLTALECRLLQMFYLNAGLPLSREELIEQLMGIPYNPLNRSIDTHISRIRNKIEKNPAKPVYIRTIRGKGYYLHIPDEESSVLPASQRRH